MKKSLLFIILLALGTSMAFAQTAETKKDTSAVKKQPVVFPHAYIGIRGGANLSDMVYTHSGYDRYDHFLQLNGMAGIFGHFQLGKSNFAIRPEVSYVGRGDSLNWCDVQYRFQAHYIDFRMPITYNFRFKGSRFSPYLMVVPQYNMAFGGKVNYRDEIDYPQGASTTVTSADIRKFDAAVMAGLGFDYLIKTSGMPILFSLEAGYNYGGHNTFAPKEIKDNPNIVPNHFSHIANNFYGAELWNETRKNRGIEIAMRLALPIDGSWRKEKEQPQQQIDSVRKEYIEVIVRDTVRDTIKERIIIPTTVERTDTLYRNTNTGYIHKDCYTIREMIGFIYLGQDISDKRMCLSSINFDFDKYTLRSAAKPQLDEMVQMMKTFPEINIIVMGHTDSIGSEDYNQRLSLNRAKEVIRYLNSRGISMKRMEAQGYGEQYPYTTNSTEEGRDQNRRVEIEIQGLGLKATEQSTEIK